MLYVEDTSLLAKYGFTETNGIFTLNIIQESDDNHTQSVYMAVNSFNGGEECRTDGILRLGTYACVDGLHYYEEDFETKQIEVIYDLITDGIVNKIDYLPCPFCNKIPKIEITKYTPSKEPGTAFSMECSCGIRTHLFKDKQDLIDFWNKRSHNG